MNKDDWELKMYWSTEKGCEKDRFVYRNTYQDGQYFRCKEKEDLRKITAIPSKYTSNEIKVVSGEIPNMTNLVKAKDQLTYNEVIVYIK